MRLCLILFIKRSNKSAIAIDLIDDLLTSGFTQRQDRTTKEANMVKRGQEGPRYLMLMYYDSCKETEREMHKRL